MQHDHIFIDDLEASARVGCSKEERSFPQLVSFSLKIYLPLKESGLGDDLKLSVDYAQVIIEINTICKQKEFVLLEALAENVATTILKHRSVEAVDVAVSKRIIAGVKSTGVSIHRNKLGTEKSLKK